MNRAPASFSEFWPFYLSQHRHPLSRLLHYLGTVTGVATLLASPAAGEPRFLPVAIIAGYGPAWVGHFFFEKNRPASFRHPLWSLRGDFRMLFCFVTGRLARELAEHRNCGE